MITCLCDSLRQAETFQVNIYGQMSCLTRMDLLVVVDRVADDRLVQCGTEFTLCRQYRSEPRQTRLIKSVLPALFLRLNLDSMIHIGKNEISR